MAKILIEKIYIKDNILKVIIKTDKDQNMYELENDVPKAISDIYEIKKYNLKEYWYDFNGFPYENHKAGDTIIFEWYTNTLNGIKKVRKRDFKKEGREELAYQKTIKEAEEKRKREKEIDSILEKIKQKILEKESNDKVFENFKKSSGSFNSLNDLNKFLKE